MFKKRNLAIVIASLGDKKYLNKCLEAIANQSIRPNQIIIVLPEGQVFHHNLHNLFIYYSKIKNQVFQRNLGISKLRKNIKILLQLDDRVILQKNAIKNLLNSWNQNSNKNIAGIGLNEISEVQKHNFFNSQISLLNILIFKIFEKFGIFKPGSVLLNGMCLQYSNLKKLTKVSWLKGGLSSYDLSKVKKIIYNRTFPKIKWSVCEDLIFSYYLSKKYKLLVCSSAKVQVLKKTANNHDIRNEYYMGKLYSENLKYFINSNKDLSLSLYTVSSLGLSFFGIIRGLFFFNWILVSRNFGRLVGIFSKNLFDC
jgi:glycosyltransferase involved in cell wall biosynthesis